MKKKIFSHSVSILFGLLFSFIGFVNTFWGNDPYYGLLIILASILFYLPVINLLIDKVPERVLLILKVILGLLIIWTSLGVGELFDKLEIMSENFPLPRN